MMNDELGLPNNNKLIITFNNLSPRTTTLAPNNNLSPRTTTTNPKLQTPNYKPQTSNHTRNFYSKGAFRLPFGLVGHFFCAIIS